MTHRKGGKKKSVVQKKWECTGKVEVGYRTDLIINLFNFVCTLTTFISR